MSVDRAAAARVLEQIASYLELKGENPFRVRAFRTASKAVGSLAAEPADALADGTLAATKGVGPGILAVLKELVSLGRSELLEQLREEVPPGIVEMLGIPGLGVSRIRTIQERLGIETLGDLEVAAQDGRLAALAGFGPKTAETVLKGIGFLRRARAFRLSHLAREEAEALRAALARLPGVVQAVVAGEVRRRLEVVSELVIVVVVESPAAELFRFLGQVPGVTEVAEQDERRATLRTAGGTAVRVELTPPRNLGAVLVQATGSAAHLDGLAAHAAARGATLDPAALREGSRVVPTPDEDTLYRALGLPPIPAELREGADEIARAAAGTLPRLIERADLTGFLHCHTTWSDGTLGIEELAIACRDAGYAWVGLTDHSKAAAYAGGLSVERLHEQWTEIDAVNAKLTGVRILKGVESDILADGSLDYDDGTLAGFDFVIGSIHSRFAMSEEEMTGRILRAMDSPFLTVLGHPTGRLLLSREPYPLDMERILRKAGANGISIEINADPHRLDLDWRLLRRARELGVAISIGSDAHDRAGIGNMEYGVGIARKGWLTAAEVLNTRDAEGFLAFARTRRKGAKP